MYDSRSWVRLCIAFTRTQSELNWSMCSLLSLVVKHQGQALAKAAEFLVYVRWGSRDTFLIAWQEIYFSRKWCMSKDLLWISKLWVQVVICTPKTKYKRQFCTKIKGLKSNFLCGCNYTHANEGPDVSSTCLRVNLKFSEIFEWPVCDISLQLFQF